MGRSRMGFLRGPGRAAIPNSREGRLAAKVPLALLVPHDLPDRFGGMVVIAMDSRQYMPPMPGCELLRSPSRGIRDPKERARPRSQKRSASNWDCNIR
jgi:hypothetical protein